MIAMLDVDKYINDWFLNLNIDKMPYSFYVIRTSLLKAVNDLKPKIHGTIVDLACGVMPYKNYLMSSTIDQYIGIDLKPTEYHNAVKPDLYWDGNKIPVEDNYCDFVIATEFLEHYYDTKHILTEIKRILKPGGVFFFTVPAIWPLHEVPYDYHRFTPFFFDKCLDELGYTSWNVKPLGGYHLSFALSLSLWYDNKLSRRRKKVIKPLIKPIIRRLVKKDKLLGFHNGNFYSGLYGFITK